LGIVDFSSLSEMIRGFASTGAEPFEPRGRAFRAERKTPPKPSAGTADANSAMTAEDAVFRDIGRSKHSKA
jgi:hypothetical protein